MELPRFIDLLLKGGVLNGHFTNYQAEPFDSARANYVYCVSGIEDIRRGSSTIGGVVMGIKYSIDGTLRTNQPTQIKSLTDCLNDCITSEHTMGRIEEKREERLKPNLSNS